MGAIMEPIRQLFRHNFITTGAFLTGMVRFHFGELLAGTCSLALQFQSKVTSIPRPICSWQGNGSSTYW